MTIHFICRGNIFRSFIAETYLRSLQLEDIETFSSGTLAEKYKIANTPNHKAVRQVLSEKGLSKYMKPNYAEQLTQQKLDDGDVNVFVYTVAHQEAVNFGLEVPSNSLVWDIEDFDSIGGQTVSEEEHRQFILDTFQKITEHVDKLVEEKHRA
jgi:protein-tyrosine-phosphatase